MDCYWYCSLEAECFVFTEDLEGLSLLVVAVVTAGSEVTADSEVEGVGVWSVLWRARSNASFLIARALVF